MSQSAILEKLARFRTIGARNSAEVLDLGNRVISGGASLGDQGRCPVGEIIEYLQMLCFAGESLILYLSLPVIRMGRQGAGRDCGAGSRTN